jgi:hypothetical protein
MDLLRDEADRVQQAWGAKRYMMGHVEIRALNWDASCRRRDLDAGKILADHVGECVKLLPGCTVYVWNDMFDPYHNAVANYHLVRGDLKGAWEGLSKDVIIMNWNWGERDKSLRFFAERGHRQVIAGPDTPESARDWLASAADVKGIVGIMYTTFNNDYTNMEAFAKACQE